MKKSLGFTLVELLAVIVILAIILAIAVPGISNIIDNSRLNSFNLSSKMLKEAANTYVNTNSITVADGTTVEVLYSDIKSAGYISKILDPISNNECTNSKVYITNTGGIYTYKEALVCDNYMDIDTYNLLTNSDFSNGTTGWFYSGGTTSVSNNILTSTGSGTQPYTQEYQSILSAAVINHKYYLRSKVRVTNASSTSLTVLIANGSQYLSPATQSTPVQNQWYTLSGIRSFASLTGTTLTLYIGAADYSDAATASGKVMQIDGTNGIYAFDLTAIYGAGNEPTATQINNIMSNMGK